MIFSSKNNLFFFAFFYAYFLKMNILLSLIYQGFCAFAFPFFLTFFCQKNRHIFLRFFALKNVIFFTIKNAKKISKNISFWRFKFHYFYFIFTQHQSNQ